MKCRPRMKGNSVIPACIRTYIVTFSTLGLTRLSKLIRTADTQTSYPKVFNTHITFSAGFFEVHDLFFIFDDT